MPMETSYQSYGPDYGELLPMEVNISLMKSDHVTSLAT